MILSSSTSLYELLVWKTFSVAAYRPSSLREMDLVCLTTFWSSFCFFSFFFPALTAKFYVIFFVSSRVESWEIAACWIELETLIESLTMVVAFFVLIAYAFLAFAFLITLAKSFKSLASFFDFSSFL